jgi:hypothetical protein
MQSIRTGSKFGLQEDVQMEYHFLVHDDPDGLRAECVEMDGCAIRKPIASSSSIITAKKR